MDPWQLTIHQCLMLLDASTQLANYKGDDSHRAKVDAFMKEKRGLTNLLHRTPEHW